MNIDWATATRCHHEQHYSRLQWCTCMWRKEWEQCYTSKSVGLLSYCLCCSPSCCFSNTVCASNKQTFAQCKMWWWMNKQHDWDWSNVWSNRSTRQRREGQLGTAWYSLATVSAPQYIIVTDNELHRLCPCFKSDWVKLISVNNLGRAVIEWQLQLHTAVWCIKLKLFHHLLQNE